ncbi:LysE/ArgO family amino acid transporter [Bartonella sp. DGB2]|uniref:LysE/ArgO family amino acid transporter n=1 Tax=Bartonella sp. DGB2 TaxID=3388426 RepID=UPI0039900A0B
MDAFISGFFFSLSLIFAIGAQNAFVLRQGLQRQHVLAVVLACALSDTILIITGVAGFGFLILQFPRLESLMTLAGGVFLLIYGLKSLWAAFYQNAILNPLHAQAKSLRKTLWITLAFTWLNPHVYLDTVVLLGTISTHYSPHKVIFAAGAIIASFIFFFSLGYGARLLAPFFARPAMWRFLDFLIAIIMGLLAFRLLTPFLFSVLS